MDQEIEHVSTQEAQQALSSVQAITAKARQRGVYSRSYAIGLALWAGAFAATMGSWLWLVVIAVGVWGYTSYRKKRGAWIKEVQTKRDLWIVLAFAVPIGALYVGAFVGLTHYAWTWAPWIAGFVIAALMFAITEIAYGPLREATGEGRA